MIVDRHQVIGVIQESCNLGLSEGVDALLDVTHIADSWLPLGVWWRQVTGKLLPRPP